MRKSTVRHYSSTDRSLRLSWLMVVTPSARHWFRRHHRHLYFLRSSSSSSSSSSGSRRRRTSAVTRAAAWLESSGSHLCLSNCFSRLACASPVLLRSLIGTLNSRLQSVQTPSAGVVPNHLTTLRRRWIMAAFPRWNRAFYFAFHCRQRARRALGSRSIT